MLNGITKINSYYLCLIKIPFRYFFDLEFKLKFFAIYGDVINIANEI